MTWNALLIGECLFLLNVFVLYIFVWVLIDAKAARYERAVLIGIRAWFQARNESLQDLMKKPAEAKAKTYN